MFGVHVHTCLPGQGITQDVIPQALLTFNIFYIHLFIYLFIHLFTVCVCACLQVCMCVHAPRQSHGSQKKHLESWFFLSQIDALLHGTQVIRFSGKYLNLLSQLAIPHLPLRDSISYQPGAHKVSYAGWPVSPRHQLSLLLSTGPYQENFFFFSFLVCINIF